MSDNNISRCGDRTDAMRGSVRAAVVLSIGLLFAYCARAHTEKLPQQIVITHVTVIDPGTPSLRRDGAAGITGRRITAVSDAPGFPVPKSSLVIDGRGQYLLPGLWDM